MQLALVFAVVILTAPLCAASPFVGYLLTYFLYDRPAIFMKLSNGNDPSSLTTLKRGAPILVPTGGTGGVRDPSLIVSPDGDRFWIIGTDLDIAKTTWQDAIRTGSRAIYVWESSDLVQWSQNRLVVVEQETAGMVWAPSAIHDPASGQYFVFWSSLFYRAEDTKHTGTPIGDHTIRVSRTSDFVTFEPASDYIQTQGLIDQEFQFLGQAGHYARFLKDERAKKVYQEITTMGIMSSNWTRVGGPEEFVAQEGTEGPASFQDNVDPTIYHLWMDNYNGKGGYRLYNTKDITRGKYSPAQPDVFLDGVRHGAMTPLTSPQYDSLKKLV